MGQVEFVGSPGDQDGGVGIDDDVEHVPDNMADHFAGAYKKGARAFREGKTRMENPYDARYNPDSCLGGEWGHVWANAWRLGHLNEEKYQNDDDIRTYRKAFKLGR
jgi:hypothetical protein